MNYDKIPAELKKLDQWVCTWDGSKCPMSAYGYEGASSSDPETWASFEQAAGCVEQGYYDHVGFVFAKDNGIVGIDIDVGFDEDGFFSPLCTDIIKHCHSYTEKSKSGRGVHIFLKGVLPFSGRNNGSGVEIYCEKRYFITTGKVMIFDEIIENQDGIDYVLNHYFTANYVKDSKEPSNLKSEGGKFQRYGGRVKNYTPGWKKRENGRLGLKPEYPEILKGGRNISLLSLAGQLWKAGYSEKEVYTELLSVNEKQCKPPLTVGEVQRIANSITKYERS